MLRPKPTEIEVQTPHVGAISAHFSLLSASWVHFWRLAAFVAPVGRFFHDLGRSSLDFGAPSWPYVGTHFALDGIFRHAAGIAAKKPCWHSLSAFRFHYAARRYVRSTWNWFQNAFFTRGDALL